MKGKKLERKIFEWLKEGSSTIYPLRIYDAMSMGTTHAPTVPADFVLSVMGRFVMIECKEHQLGKPFPLTNFRPSQLKAMEHANKTGLYEYYVIINDRIIDGRTLVRYIRSNPDVKSLSTSFIEENGYLLSNKRMLIGYLVG